MWPHASLGRLEDRLWVRVHQWGLGAYERYLAGEGEQWLQNAIDVGRVRAVAAARGRRARRAVAQPPPVHEDLPAGGRLAVRDGAGRGRQPAHPALPGDPRRALRGGRAAGRARDVAAQRAGRRAGALDGSPWPEEYPTAPPSYVLNGGIFALWGYYDVGAGLGDADAGARVRARAPTCWPATCIAGTPGYWSRYDLFPHPVLNVASSFYHALHTSQLRGDERDRAARPSSPTPRSGSPRYAESRVSRNRAFARKVLFRLAVPRNEFMSKRMRRLRRRAGLTPRVSDVLVLCYHAVSPRWPADLSVTPEAFERQLQLLVGRGYRGATFHEAVTSPPTGPRWRSPSTTPTCRCWSSRSRSWTGSGWSARCSCPTDYPEREEPMAWPGIDQWLGGEHEPELRPMNWAQMRDLAESGWEIGSHTCSHPHLTELDDRHARPRDDRVAQGMRAAPGPPVHDDRVSVRRLRRARRGRSGARRVSGAPARCRRASTRRSRWSGRAWACTTATTTAASA